MPEQLTLTADRNVPVPMRDGTVLYADVYRPAGPGPYPALLQRTPYDKQNQGTAMPFILRAAARAATPSSSRTCAAVSSPRGPSSPSSTSGRMVTTRSTGSPGNRG